MGTIVVGGRALTRKLGSSARPIDAVAALAGRGAEGRLTWIKQHQPTLSSKDIAYLLQTITADHEVWQEVERLAQLGFMAPCMPEPVTAEDISRILRLFPLMSSEERYDVLCILTDDASKVAPLTPEAAFSLSQAMGIDEAHPSYGSIAMHHLLWFQSRPLTFDDLVTASRAFTTCSDCVAEDLRLLAEKEITPLSFSELIRLCALVSRDSDRATVLSAYTPHLAGDGTFGAEEEEIVQSLFRARTFFF